MLDMYRRYEDPGKLEAMLAEAERELTGCPGDPDICEWIYELKNRINQAWADDEYESEW